MTRINLPALLVAVPAIIVAVALAALEGSRLTRQSSSTALVEGSLGEALRGGELEQAFAFIRAGQDPNRPVVFRDQETTGDREILIAPLLIAVAYNRDDSVSMLMSAGARLDAPGNRFAVCLANRLGHEDIAELIIRDGRLAASDVTCPEATPSPEAPLLVYVE